MSRLTPAKRARIQAANDLVLELLGNGLPAHEVIDELIERSVADQRFRNGTHQLVAAGIVGETTSGTSELMLGSSWRKNKPAAPPRANSSRSCSHERVTIQGRTPADRAPGTFPEMLAGQG